MRGKLTRRRFLATTAASTALIAMPYVRGSHAAGRLSIGFWDHWVPSANNTSNALVEEWAAKEKVEVLVDYIPTQGQKLLLTIAAEAQAKSGHDILALSTWLPSDHANQLEPVDDIVEPLIKQNGAVNATVEYLGKSQGRWIAVPATIGSQIKGPCSRIDLMKQHAGIDVQAMYPAGAPPKAENWTLEAFLKAAEACQKAGFPFGIGLGTTPDSVDTAGAIFHSFGAMLVDAKGNVTVKSDPVRQAPGRLPGAMRRRSPNSAGPTAWPRARRAGLHPASPISGESGRSARTRMRQKACWCISRSRRQSKSWWLQAAATTCRRSPISPPLKPGRRKSRRREHCIIIPTHTITRSCRSPGPRPRRRSRCRSTSKAS